MITDIANMLENRPYICVINMYPRKIHKVIESDNGSIVKVSSVIFIDLLA